MKVFMLGWEFPPYNVGGLGIACEGLAKSFIRNGMSVTFVMPNAPKDAKSDFLNLVVASHQKITIEDIDGIDIKKIPALLRPYMTSTEYSEELKRIKEKKIIIESNDTDFSLDEQYGNNFLAEIWRYSKRVSKIAKNTDFDIIHAHDWMTYPAGIEAKKITGKPLIVHIHNTAFDRSGGNPSSYEYDIEYEGFTAADKIIAISKYVKDILISKYNIPNSKIEVVHNGIDKENYSYVPTQMSISKKDKIVLFAGRVTLQKGPEYFINAAKLVSEKMKNVKFVLAGNGDMLNRSINQVADMGLSDRFVFSGRYNREEGLRLMSMADVFVMPSVSEPFGLVPLEAMLQKTPTIISKQSGVSEVLANTLKVDFWDINQLANKIISCLKYDALNEQLSEYGEHEAKNLTWDPAADKCRKIFGSFLS